VSYVQSNKAGVIKAAMQGCARNVTSLCELMSMEAKNLSPRATGNNANSIATDLKKGENVTGRVYTQSGYGGWLEIGTARMPARPYFVPAYNYAKANVK
jgi:HK97 gp10 family phage protein